MTHNALFDLGLQPERTALAWRRSVLGLAVGAVVALRILPPLLGAWAIGAGLTGLVSAAAIWILASRRARAVHKSLLTSSPLPGGGLLLHLTITVTVGAALGLTVVTMT
jgi:putative membrane protein